MAVCLALAAHLRGAGWDVAVHGPPSLAARVAGLGLPFDGRDAPDPWDVTAMAIDARAACERRAPDVAVVDYMLPGALCGAEAAGVPTAALVHTLYAALLDDASPPAPHPMSMAASPSSLAAARTSLALPPVAGLGALLSRCDAVLVTSLSWLDTTDPAAEAGNVRYVGALVAEAGPDAGWVPPPGEGPLVVVSLGTTPMDEGPVLARVVEAVAGAPVRALVQPGAHLAGSPLPEAGNVTVAGFVRHAAVLPHAGALVTHAGLGTVLAGLSAGVPMVCLPLGREQPANAAAVARLGAGVVLPPDAPAADVRAAVFDVLATPSYRAAAAEAKAALAAWPPDRSAVAELDALAAARGA